MAVTAACLARVQDPELGDYDESIQVAVETLQQRPTFQELYVAWPKEVAVTSSDRRCS